MIRSALASLMIGLVLPVVASAQSVFINEVHYDNVSTDTNEAVEVAGPAGTSLAGWSLVLYNGNGGASYATYPLSGTISNTCAGFGAVSVATPGIQNGSPDGVALVDALSQVVQFLSYEGTMIATDGPANGMQSVDILVIEDGTEPTSSSLQLIGTGTVYPDFTWSEATASPNACNAGQTFVGGIDSPPAVFASTPADNATGISPYADLSITFTEDVNVDPDWYGLVCTTTGTVTSVVTGGPRTFTINPNVTLFPGESCVLTISASAVTDLDLPINPMDQNAVIDFTIAADAPPTVAQTQPPNGATAVFVTSNVVVTFSEPVSLTAAAFGLTCTSSGAHPFALSGGPTLYTLNPTVDLGYLETCTLTVFAAQVLDTDGTPTNPIADTTISFGTEQSIADYYATANASTAATLRATLNAIIDDHIRFPYTSSSTDTWDILDAADEDPMTPANVLDVYKNATYPKAGAGNANYNREHRWAKSFGFPDDSSNSWAYTDTHHLIVSNSGYNSARNNRYFDYCADACTEYPTDLTNGIGGGSGAYPGNSNWGKGERWEVWGYRRGDVARALLYMDIRYEGGLNGSGAPEPDLVLTNNPALIQTTGINTTGTAYLGLLCVLLEWHAQDPPDELERIRNALIQTYQQNRNPFVDHPEWADTLFASECESVFSDGFE